MKSIQSIYALSLIAVVLGGCSQKPKDNFVAKPPETIPPATVTPGNEGSLFPLDKGNQWSYTVTYVTRVSGQDQPEKNSSTTWTVTDSKQTPNGIEATIETASPNSPFKDHQSWRSNSKGIYELAAGTPTISYNPPLPVIVFPVKADFTYKWSGTGPNGTKQGGSQSSQRIIRASQEVDTAMGKMSAIPVEDIGTVTISGKKGTSTSTTWFAPGVGIVRLRQEVVVGNSGYVLLLKLKSKSLMKS